MKTLSGRSRTAESSKTWYAGFRTQELPPLLVEWGWFLEEPTIPLLVAANPPLPEPLETLGMPRVRLRLAASQPQAMVAVRLSDVAPDGAATRVSYGLLNLSHRDSHAQPEALEPGRPLTFLESRVQCGNALVGVFDPDVLEELAEAAGVDREVARDVLSVLDGRGVFGDVALDGDDGRCELHGPASSGRSKNPLESADRAGHDARPRQDR